MPFRSESGARLGDADGADEFAARQPRQQAQLLFGGAVIEQVMRGDAVHALTEAAQAAPVELLVDHRFVAKVAAGAAVARRECRCTGTLARRRAARFPCRRRAARAIAHPAAPSRFRRSAPRSRAAARAPRSSRRGAAGPRRSLRGLEVDELDAFRDLLSGGYPEGVQGAVLGCDDRVLDLHGLEDQERCALGHLAPAAASSSMTRPGIGERRPEAAAAAGALMCSGSSSASTQSSPSRNTCSP